MAVLLVFTIMLLFCYVHADSTALATQKFSIRKAILSIEPDTEVAWGANVTLRCQAVLDKPVARSLEFAIYKGKNLVCAQTLISTMNLLCPLTKVKQVNTGRYWCAVKFEDKQEISEAKKLMVKDGPPPFLYLNPVVVTEGEEIALTCTAPERPSEFYFYKDSNEIKMMDINSTQAVLKHRITRSGIHKFHCSYELLVDRKPYESKSSNTVTVTAKELDIKPVLEIAGPSKIYEGDQLFLTCSINGSLPRTTYVNLLLKQDTQFLCEGYPKVNHSSVVLAEGLIDFECELDMERVVKTTSKKVSVAELFSAPTLTMSKAEVFQKDDMTFICRSDIYASERLDDSQLMYSLDPPQDFLYSRNNGVFYGKAPRFEFNISCVAKLKGITKHSQVFTLFPKVPVSIPEISVVGHAILGRPVKILCRSYFGSPPIYYTLIKDYNVVSNATVWLASEEAIFTVAGASDLKSYMCEAKNSERNPQLSRRLNATVTVPLSNPKLLVVPALEDISEGNPLFLICSVNGTPPVTFKWYRSGKENPEHAATSFTNNTSYQIPIPTKKDSGRYRCEAVNNANNIVNSDFVDIQVRMALWKKALIGGVCALVLSVLVMVLVLYFKSRKVNRPEISIWTQRPPENEFSSDTVDNEESSVVTTEPDVEYTEVVHAQPADPNRVLRRQGTDTVYSELQKSTHGVDGHDSYVIDHQHAPKQGLVEYTVYNGVQEEITDCPSEVNGDHGLP